MLPVAPGQLHERNEDRLIYVAVLHGGGLECHYQDKNGTVLQRIYRDDGKQFYNLFHKPQCTMVSTGLMYSQEGLKLSCSLSNQDFQTILHWLDPQKKRGWSNKRSMET